ncbi:hypothetical protein E2C01_018876 [Portunus trituberculatus]|uniref:Uncharacterized protein n=1 Tax=Portunus trituberculatus TaxID=210409 RepID=A0A5B7DY96_PORTR|nr:hypothetical protein [Portunus trituberculatus]
MSRRALITVGGRNAVRGQVRILCTAKCIFSSRDSRTTTRRPPVQPSVDRSVLSLSSGSETNGIPVLARTLSA